MCGNFRRTARTLTQLYDQALRPLGLRATQFTILQFLSLAGEVSRGKDRRERWLRLAKAGETQLNRALPVWEKVQTRLRRQVGEQAWKNLLQLTNQVAELVTSKGDSK